MRRTISTTSYSYIAADRPQAADALADRIEQSLALLSKNPHMGRVPREEELARLGYRYLAIESYLLFYTIEGETVCVHRIVHGAREYVRLV